MEVGTFRAKRKIFPGNIRGKIPEISVSGHSLLDSSPRFDI